MILIGFPIMVYASVENTKKDGANWHIPGPSVTLPVTALSCFYPFAFRIAAEIGRGPATKRELFLMSLVVMVVASPVAIPFWAIGRGINSLQAKLDALKDGERKD